MSCCATRRTIHPSCESLFRILQSKLTHVKLRSITKRLENLSVQKILERIETRFESMYSIDAEWGNELDSANEAMSKLCDDWLPKYDQHWTLQKGQEVNLEALDSVQSIMTSLGKKARAEMDSDGMSDLDNAKLRGNLLATTGIMALNCLLAEATKNLQVADPSNRQSQVFSSGSQESHLSAMKPTSA